MAPNDTEAPSETTRLIERPSTPSTANSPLRLERGSQRPAISPVVRHIQAHGVDSFTESFDDSLRTANDAERTAFELVVLLQLYIHTTRPAPRGQDIWDDWSKDQDRGTDQETLQRLTANSWASFVSRERTVEELEACLWMSFPLDPGKSRLVRVVDMLQDPNAPQGLLSHDLVMRSLKHTWKFGLARRPADSTIGRIRRALVKAVTPRVLHALDLVIHLLYLGLLAHYLLYPPTKPVITLSDSSVEVRGILLLIYAMSNVLGVFNYFLPSLLIALAFLSTLPASPFPGDTSYAALSAGFLLHVILLHLPRAPNPCLLMPESILPLSTLFFHEFSSRIYPAMLFFSPALIIGLYLLSLSLVEDSPIILPPPGPSIASYVMAAPMEVREAFLALLATVLVLMVFSSCLLILFGGAMPTSSEKSVSKWDRYSFAAGNRARRTFLAAVARYTTSYYFPPPFNLPPLLFVYLPVGFLRLYGARGRRVTRFVEGVFWWCTVGLCSLVIAGCNMCFTVIPYLVQQRK